MTISYRPAKREDIRLLLGVAGGTGSGKTYSAFRLARGLTGGDPFHVIDTENERALMYADEFDFLHADLKAPFRPSRYTEAIKVADKAGAKVIVVDSTSHSWAGDGGMLDWHEQLEGGNPKKKMTAWIEPKADHRKFVTELLQVRAHVILCFRAEPKVDIVMKDGEMKIVPKATLTGLDGWIPIADKNLPFELTASFLLMADAPGIPKPIKLPEKLRPYIPLKAPLDETVGEALAAWAKGSAADPSVADKPGASLSPPGPEPRAPGPEAPRDAPDLTDAQRDQLDALRRDYSIEQLIATLARDRGIAADQIAADDWPMLREKLTEAEAASWIERMSKSSAGAAA